MHCSGTLFSILALPGVLAMPSSWYSLLESRRTATTNATLYAYGTNISGLPVLYDEANGALYISANNATLSGLQSLTWDIPAISASSTTAATATAANGTAVGGLLLNSTTTSTTGSSGVTPVAVGATGTMGLTVYGQQLVYKTASSFEAKFWAQEATFDGAAAYAVTWNTANTVEAGLTPLTLKTLGPATVST